MLARIILPVIFSLDNHDWNVFYLVIRELGRVEQ